MMSSDAHTTHQGHAPSSRVWQGGEFQLLAQVERPPGFRQRLSVKSLHSRGAPRLRTLERILGVGTDIFTPGFVGVAGHPSGPLVRVTGKTKRRERRKAKEMRKSVSNTAYITKKRKRFSCVIESFSNSPSLQSCA